MSKQLYIKNALEHGKPCYGFDDIVPKSELRQRVSDAQEACLAAHDTLYRGDAPVILFDDEHSGEIYKYISFADSRSQPCYHRWDERYPATDIGIRGVNLGFDGAANPTTVVHADNEAAKEFADAGAPDVLVDALDSVGLLNKFVVSQVVRPMLAQIATEYGANPDDYIAKFLPEDRRIRTLTRVIMYHLEVPENIRPVGSDGQKLLIKEHNDQSSFTIDSSQSSPGLQYFVDGSWQPAETSIACMRGTADDLLYEKMKPTLHRAIFDKDTLDNAPENMRSVGIGRVATPTFVSPSGDSVRVVQPSSPETHPLLTIDHHNN